MARGKRSSRRNRNRNIRNRRSGRKGRSLSEKASSGVLHNARTVGVPSIKCLRSLTPFPTKIGSDGKTSVTWLDNMISYGAVAMKMLAVLISSGSLTATAYPVAAVQSILLGPEDLLLDHALVEDAGSTTVAIKRKIDYSKAKVKDIKITISLMGKVSERAGRICAVVVPLSREEAYDYQSAIQRIGEKGVTNANDNDISFVGLMQMPGAIVSPSNQPLEINYRPTGFCGSWLEIGQYLVPRPGEIPLIGGLPIIKLMVGYQDFANAEAAPNQLYGLSEATISIEIQSTLSLTNSSTRVIRTVPKSLMSTTSIGLHCGGKFINIPIMEDGAANIVSTSDGYAVSMSAVHREALGSLESMAL